MRQLLIKDTQKISNSFSKVDKENSFFTMQENQGDFICH